MGKKIIITASILVLVFLGFRLAVIKQSSKKLPDQTYRCDGTPAFQHATFNCPDGWEKHQEPAPPNFKEEFHVRKIKDSDGEVTQINELTVGRYWKSVIMVPTACHQKGEISASTTVEQAKEYSAEITSELGKAGVTVSLKTTNTLGFKIDIGEDKYQTKNELYQRWTYVKLKERDTGFSAAVAWYLWGGGSTCEEDQQPENKFDLFVCRKKCED